MADENTTATATTDSKAPKAKTVGEDMATRRIFGNIDSAVEYLGASAESFSDFDQMTIAAPGMDEEGNFDPEIYSDDKDVMVSILRNQRKVKAIVVAPIPRINALLESDEGRKWVEKILYKELNHVAVRHLRDAEDVSTVTDQIPTTLDAYITSGRDGGGGIMESFDELYKQINATMAKLPVWAKARFTKGELKKALESKGYASEYYPAVEDYKGKSLFETALELAIAASARKGLDPTIFQRWADTRNNKTFNAGDDADEDELNTDALLGALMEADAKPAEAATDSTAPEGDAPAPATDSEGQTATA
jgi:hypothetical protein